MCGIIGYTGYRQASIIALDALRRLEYREYDSVGMAVSGSNGIEIRKDIGRVDEVNAKHDFCSMKGTQGIGHTRWATHGGVTQLNAHPHISNDGKIVVIHNGIVENYQELKQKLQSEGFTFQSETDTEAIPNLIECEMKKGNNSVCLVNPNKSLDRANPRRTPILRNLHHRRHNPENTNTHRPKLHGNNIQHPRTILQNIHIIHPASKKTKRIQVINQKIFCS